MARKKIQITTTVEAEKIKEVISKTEETITLKAEEIPTVEPNVEPEIVKEPEYRWKKMGHGSFLLRGRYIKQDQVFMACESEIPAAFRDVVILLDKIPVTTMTPKKNSEYKAVLREGTELYDIVDKQGKRLNEKPLENEDALMLLSVL